MIVRFLSMLWIVPLVLAACAAVPAVVRDVCASAGRYGWFAAGMGVQLALSVALHGRMAWLRTFAHEAAHSMVALLLLGHIREFSATASAGGHVRYDGVRFGTLFVALAPYCLPYMAYVSALVAALVDGRYRPAADAVTGFALMFHLVCFACQTRTGQPDIRDSGCLRSLLFIAGFGVVNVSVVVRSVACGLWQAVCLQAADMWQALQGMAHTLLAHLA